MQLNAFESDVIPADEQTVAYALKAQNAFESDVIPADEQTNWESLDIYERV